MPWRGAVLDGLVVTVGTAAIAEILLRRLPGPVWLLVAAVPLYTLPLLARHRWPFAAPLFAVAVQVGSSFVDAPGGSREYLGVIAYLLTFWVFGAENPARRAGLGLLAAEAGIVLVTLEDVRVVATDSLSVAEVGLATWIAAVVLRRRGLRADAAEQLAATMQRQRLEATAALAAQRAQLARELHDVVAHSVSVMTVQAGAARMLLNGHPEQATAPLLAIEETGRQALGELRRMLGVLRAGDEGMGFVPQPGLDDLPTLLKTVGEAGLPATLEVTGTPRPLSPGLGLTAYRIVQESLTNALRHAHATHARVVVGYGADELRLEVHDDGRGQSAGGIGDGHGLAGMRERVALYGGSLDVTPAHDGGLTVRARLPVERVAP